MNPGHVLLTGTLILGLAVGVGDLAYLSRFKVRYQKIQDEKVKTSHQLATARIISENLPQVRDLVFHNMEFPGSQDEKQAESILLEFLSESMEGAGLALTEFEPVPPVTNGVRSTYQYRISMVGGLEELGNFARRLENHRRLVSLVEWEFLPTPDSHRGKAEGRIKALVESYRLRRQL